eukprot:TRINITY_DN3609_c0_g3_i10.p1 TRINITY_DN3609_c0_g3~~TRINITY_DN3609_c0_g3_i10.p1  ORF type:complete len:305 (-),score=6.96 TRINITY_DN3609_c0_g3_i10:762-1676(-)
MIMPLIGSFLGVRASIYICVSTKILIFLILTLFVPESLSDHARIQAGEESKVEKNCAWKLFASIRMIFSRKLFIQLTLCNMIYSFAFNGLVTVLLQYFQLVYDFNAQQIGEFFFVLGGGALAAQGIILPLLQKPFGEKWILFIGFFGCMIQFVGLAVVTSSWQVYVVQLASSIGALIFPTVSGIKSNNVEEHQQGGIQGGLYGLTGFATGLGPVVFAYIFFEFTSSESQLPYCPQFVLLFGGIVVFLALVLVLSIDDKEARNKIQSKRLSQAIDSDRLLQDYDDKGCYIAEECASQAYTVAAPL